MLLYLILFLLVNKMIRSKGRNSPLWGIFSVLLLMFFDEIFFYFLISNLDFFYENGLSDSDIILWSYTIPFISSFLVLASFYIIILFVKPKNFRNEKKATWVNYKYLGFVMVFITFYKLTASILTFGLTLGAFLTIGLGGTVSFYCFRFHEMGKRLSLEQEIIKNNHKLVLLLRSFDQASSRIRGIPEKIRKKIYYDSFFKDLIFGYTYDELLLPFIEEKIGSVVALGDPNDYLPSLGSKKIYIPDNSNLSEELWWDTAVQLMNRSEIIILLESYGQNVLRELIYIRNNLDPKKLFILSYPNSFINNNQKKFQDLSSDFFNICNEAKITIPSSRGSVLSFRSNWECISSKQYDDNINEIVNYIVQQINYEGK